MKIEYKNGILEIDGKRIATYNDMYSLSDLMAILKDNGIYHKSFASVINSASFGSKLCGLIDTPLDGNSMISTLKNNGMYKAVGLRENMKVYCVIEVFITLLIEYSPETYKGVVDMVI